MLSSNNACRRHGSHPAESANPTLELALAEDDAEIKVPSTRDQRWESPCAEIEHASKFIKGLTIALPASITLWACIILGLKAIF
jgi:hypothetical protein